MKHSLTVSLFTGAVALAGALALAGCGSNQTETGAPTENMPMDNTKTTDNKASTPAGAKLGTQRAAGPFQATLSTQPEEPKEGDTRFQVEVTRNGTPVTNATVKLDLSMPTMNMGGPNVTLKHTGNGVYTGTANLSMGGYWEAKVLVSSGGQSGTAVYGFNAMQAM